MVNVVTKVSAENNLTINGEVGIFLRMVSVLLRISGAKNLEILFRLIIQNQMVIDTIPIIKLKISGIKINLT